MLEFICYKRLMVGYMIFVVNNLTARNLVKVKVGRN